MNFQSEFKLLCKFCGRSIFDLVTEESLNYIYCLI